jgi:hypothetical protein
MRSQGLVLCCARPGHVGTLAQAVDDGARSVPLRASRGAPDIRIRRSVRTAQDGGVGTSRSLRKRTRARTRSGRCSRLG